MVPGAKRPGGDPHAAGGGVAAGAGDEQREPGELSPSSRPDPGDGHQPGAGPEFVGPPASEPDPRSAGARARDEADQPGDEERGWRQNEIHDAVRDALYTLGSIGSRTSGVTIVAKKATFSGPVVGGDIGVTGQGDGSALLWSVSKPMVTAISRVYVQPRGYAELQSALDRDHLLPLFAPARWGSTTTAIELLSRLSAVHELKFGGALSALPVEGLPRECGFFLERLAAAQLADLRERELAGLAERLASRGNRLVAIIDPAARLPDHAVHRRAKALQAPPPPLEFVISHLAGLLPSRERAEEFLAGHGLDSWLREMAPDTFDAGLLVELARDLAGAAAQSCTVEDVMVRFRERSHQDVDAWLDEVTDLDQRATIVSFTVLSGMPYDAVGRAATRLEQAWRSEDAGTGAVPPRMRRTRSVRLSAARAKITRELRNTRYGVAELEIASFVDDRYPARLLYHLWHEHDYDRDLIMDWLKAVAEDVEGRVRIRAAGAIGFLAQYAFDTVRREIIVPWAGSGDGDSRERAVAALAFPARHPETAARTVRLVLDWSEHAGNPLRLSAARALGTSVGAILSDGPDERLTELAEKAGPQLAIALGDSVAELLSEANPVRQLELLRLLDGWAAQTRAGRQVAGVWGFLETAQRLWTSVPAEDGSARCPILLWLATEGSRDGHAEEAAVRGAIREVIARCWGRVLLAPGADLAVHRVLRSWAGAAERAPQLRVALVGLLVQVASSRRLVDVLASHARSWRDGRALAPDLAQRLLAALHKGGTVP